MNPTLYDILGVSPDASREEIKRAWRDSSDRFEPGTGASPAQFRMFNEAAEVLLDPERRKAYDQQLAEQAAAPEGAGSAGKERPEPASEPAARAAERSATPAKASPAKTTAAQPSTAEVEKARRTSLLGLRVTTPILAVLAVLAVLSMTGAIVLGTWSQKASAYESSLDQAPSAAERAATAVLSYDYTSLDADRDAAGKFLTSGYKDDYVQTFNSLVQDNAKKTRARVQAKVLASSAMLQSGERDPDRVPVLLFVNQKTVSTANSGQPSLALNRVRLDMVNVDGTWLVDGITSY